MGKESNETVWATIDTGADTWVITEVELEKG